jgi:hypothetical protein
MKPLPVLTLSLALAASFPAAAANLMLNFRSTSANAAASGDVTAAYDTLSPGHDAGTISMAETTWNNFSSAAGSSTLSYSDGSAAPGVSVTFGNESAAGSGIISYSTVSGINTSALYGTGGATPGNLSLVSNAGSIYGSGNNSGNSAAGRAGWLGAATNTAIGMRVDGLAAGDYRVYVMSRNTNSNAASVPQFLFATTGASSTSYTFSALTAATQANTGYANTNPTAYNAFDEGENYVAIDLTLADGESLFLAADGAASGETRGFFNMVQIVAVPEPSLALLGSFGLLSLLRRRR